MILTYNYGKLTKKTDKEPFDEEKFFIFLKNRGITAERIKDKNGLHLITLSNITDNVIAEIETELNRYDLKRAKND